MIQSKSNKHVYYILPGELIEDKTMKGGWYFVDETEQIYEQSYETEKEAIDALNEYITILYRDIYAV